MADEPSVGQPAGGGGGPGAGLRSLGPDLWRWERRHPEWHPGEFGAVVASYLIQVGDVTLLIDPLVDGDADPVLEDLDDLVSGTVRILVTIPYHARSGELIWRRYEGHGARILGHTLVTKRLSDISGFRVPEDDDLITDVARFHRIGKPVRAEMPIEIPSQHALVFGDAIVESGGMLRLWESPVDADSRRRWYEERFLPTMRRLAALDVDRMLVTHGRPVLRGGHRALESALDRGPWQPPPARRTRNQVQVTA